MSQFREEGSRLVYRNTGETVWIEAHGSDTFRVRRSMSARMKDGSYVGMYHRRGKAGL